MIMTRSGRWAAEKLADAIGLRLVARVREPRDPAHGVLLRERHGVVRAGTVGGDRRNGKYMLSPRLGRRLEHVVRAVDVDVVHEALVVNGVEDEREVDERVGPGALDHGVHGPAIPHVHALEL
jgi:hypothetical protein